MQVWVYHFRKCREYSRLQLWGFTVFLAWDRSLEAYVRWLLRFQFAGVNRSGPCVY